jgi:hypothetical protein
MVFVLGIAFLFLFAMFSIMFFGFLTGSLARGYWKNKKTNKRTTYFSETFMKWVRFENTSESNDSIKTKKNKTKKSTD